MSTHPDKSSKVHHNGHKLPGRPPFECIALLLQGGGALGAYQAGVYEALAEADLHPDWVAGISIGAINSAIIAGNAPADRVTKLRAFWEGITANPVLDLAAAGNALAPKGDLARIVFNQISAGCALISGAQGFFALRQLAPWLYPNGAVEATSFYETKLLQSTLERLVDFDRVNSGETRLSVGAVNGHCQVNRLRNKLRLMMPACRALSHRLDRCLLSPGPKCFGAHTPIADSTEAMTPWPEVTAVALSFGWALVHGCVTGPQRDAADRRRLG